MGHQRTSGLSSAQMGLELCCSTGIHRVVIGGAYRSLQTGERSALRRANIGQRLCHESSRHLVLFVIPADI